MAERKVRFNKTLEDYVIRKWNQQIDEQVAKFSAEYHQKISNATSEVEALYKAIQLNIAEVMVKYNLDCSQYGYAKMPAICSLNSHYIRDSASEQAINAYHQTLLNKRDEALEDLKVECALGADRATFEAMIAKVTFD